MNLPRNPTRAVRIGSVVIGDGNPIAVQSMTATHTRDVTATVEQDTGSGFTLVNNHEIGGSEANPVPARTGLTYDPGSRGGTRRPLLAGQRRCGQPPSQQVQCFHQKPRPFDAWSDRLVGVHLRRGASYLLQL